MKWVSGGLVVLLLALPASRGDEPKKDSSPKEQYSALLKEFSMKQREIISQVQKAQGPERDKLIQQYYDVGKSFADKFYKLAEDNPKSPVAADAVFWIVSNASGSKVYEKAAAKVNTLIAEMPAKDLAQKLRSLRPNEAIVDAVVKRAEKATDAADLLAWAANASYLPGALKAGKILLEKYPDNPAVERVIASLGRSESPEAEKTLKKVAQTTPKTKLKAAANLALGRMLANRVDSLGEKPAEADKVATEAEKYFGEAIALYADDATQKKIAERELKTLKTIRVGKEAPEIKATDLDGKEFKLSDYRGKVVLLDFWGNW